MNEEDQHGDRSSPTSHEPPKSGGYERPRLKKYGSLAELTRSGTGTQMEGGKGPPRDFA